jgi:two-component system NtrC family sensor kinase
MEYFMVSFFLVQYIRSSLNTKVQLPDWDKKLVIARVISIALLGLYFAVNEEQWVNWIWHAFMITLVWTAYSRQEFYSIRTVVLSVVPFVVISFFNDVIEQIAPGFYKDNEGNLSNAKTFAFFLSFAIWIYAQKQQRVLIKEREQRLAEEKESKAQKESLEYLVAERTYELTLQKEELQKAIEELKSTQNQLIQSEKMASLGELTAGIAHEIQNPLNFVNNFSEVSVELCQELEEEIDKTTIEDSDK